VLAFIALHFWTICAGGWGGVGSAPKAPLAAILFERMLPGTALVFYLGFARMIDVHEAFGLRRLGWKKISLWAIGGTAATALICVAVSHLYGEWILRGRWGAVSLAAGDSPQNARDPLVLAGAIAIAPLSEELIFRGFVYAVVKRYSERFFAAIISSAVFAIAHYDIPALAPLFALGMCLTVAYELSGCLWVPITIHAIFNALMAHPWFGG
jgi:membrane protease YdiL (CAAX protease family)